ncbi:hypothetical protein ACWGPO_23095 [Achromobacter animicus]
MEPKFVQIAVAPPKPDLSFYVIVALAEDGSVWKAEVAAHKDETRSGWVKLSHPAA